MQTIRRRASHIQSSIDLISKPCLSSSDIKEDGNIMRAEETSLGNVRNMRVSQLRQLAEYYTHSYKLKGLEGNVLSGPNNNIISSPTVLRWIFLLPLEKKNPKFKESLIVGQTFSWLVSAQDVPFLYARSHLSALQNCALHFSINFRFIFIF